MKTNSILSILLCTLILVAGCKKDTDGDKKTGLLKFKMISPTSTEIKEIGYTKSTSSTTSNPPLVGDVTVTILKNINACVGDIWVSEGIVTEGRADNLRWIRLTDVTNTKLLFFEDYSFAPKNVPVGTYRSIKISLRNIFYWVTELKSNPTIKYELLQTMGSSLAPCNVDDQSWVIDYFSEDGNHYLINGVFKLVAPDEKIAGFTIEAGKTATVSWRWLMRGCTFNLLDLNKNRVFDCGVDDIDMVCPGYMSDFIVGYE